MADVVIVQQVQGPSGPAGTNSPYNFRSISAANSPFIPAAFQWIDVDLTAGPVVINPAALVAGQWLVVKVKPGSDPSINSLTINAPGGGQVEQVVPNQGTYGASVVFNSATQKGASIVLVSDGTNLQLG